MYAALALAWRGEQTKLSYTGMHVSLPHPHTAPLPSQAPMKVVPWGFQVGWPSVCGVWIGMVSVASSQRGIRYAGSGQ